MPGETVTNQGCFEQIGSDFKFALILIAIAFGIAACLGVSMSGAAGHSELPSELLKTGMSPEDLTNLAITAKAFLSILTNGGLLGALV